mmetsp:Transcript_12273/g.36013  ORF Transcript_12273/g.36013 Transcript_12273/m.36013 type:complete len:269 (-) Transcript_12273:75-881(-)
MRAYDFANSVRGARLLSGDEAALSAGTNVEALRKSRRARLLDRRLGRRVVQPGPRVRLRDVHQRLAGTVLSAPPVQLLFVPALVRPGPLQIDEAAHDRRAKVLALQHARLRAEGLGVAGLLRPGRDGLGMTRGSRPQYVARLVSCAGVVGVGARAGGVSVQLGGRLPAARSEFARVAALLEAVDHGEIGRRAFRGQVGGGGGGIHLFGGAGVGINAPAPAACAVADADSSDRPLLLVILNVVERPAAVLVRRAPHLVPRPARRPVIVG